MRVDTVRSAWWAVLPWLLITVLVDADEILSPPEPLPDEPTVFLAPDDYWGVSSDAGGPIQSWDGYSPAVCTGPECMANRDKTTTWGGYWNGTCSAPDLLGEFEPCDCWTVRGGAIFLRRNNNNPIPIATGTPSYSTDSLGSNYEPGPLVSVIRHGIWCTAWDLEATYFGVHDLDATATSADLDSLATTPTINIVGVVPGSTTYSTRLDSMELNLRRQRNDWLTILGGFRWLELGDTLNTDIGGLATQGVDVNNHLYGLQLGADVRLWHCGAFSLDGFGKAGVYANSSDSLTTTTGVGGALPSVVASQDHAAFVGEMALNGQYDISNRWAIRGGYQLLWLDGVALAPEQLDDVNIATGVAAVDVGQTALYHGFTLTAQYVW